MKPTIFSVLIILLLCSSAIQAQDPQNIDLVGSFGWYFPNSFIRTSFDGDFCYAHYDKLHIYDISEPQSPELLKMVDGNFTRLLKCSDNLKILFREGYFEICDFRDVDNIEVFSSTAVLGGPYIAPVISDDNKMFVINNFFIENDPNDRMYWEMHGYDFSDIRNPEEFFFQRSRDLRDVMRLDYYADFILRLYPERVEIFSIADLQELTPVSIIEPEAGDFLNFKVVDDFLYVLRQPVALEIYNIENPDNPQLVNIINVGAVTYFSTLELSGERVVIKSGQTDYNIYNVSNPAEPEMMYTIETDPTAKIRCFEYDRMVFFDDRKILSYYELGGDFEPSATYNGRGTALYADVAGDYAVMCLEDEGILISDVSDLANPQELSRTSIPDGAVRCVSNQDLSVVLSDNSLLYAVDFTNAENPVMSYIPDPYNDVRDFKLIDNLLYTLSGPDLYRLLDVSDPEDLRELSEFDLDEAGETTNFHINGNYLYVMEKKQRMERYSRLHIYDISDDNHIEYLNAFEFGIGACDLCQEGNWLYTYIPPENDRSNPAIWMYSIENPAEPEFRNSYTVENYFYILDFEVRGNYLFMLQYSRQSINLRIEIVNIADPDAPVIVGRYDDLIGCVDIEVTDAGIITSSQKQFNILDYSAALGVSGNQVYMPGTVLLNPAYPNPFNSSTRIEYTVPTTGMINLSLFDQTGRLVNVLAKGTHGAGKFSMLLDGQGLASGTYLLKLSADGNVVSRQLMLMK